MADHRPNIVLINVDDLGYGDLGCYGSSVNSTPVLDRLADGGIRFTDFVMASPVCSPSRGAMLTGCYPPRIGFGSFDGEQVLFPGMGVGLHPQERTMATLLREAGYATALVGKWHCGDQPGFLPTDHGFDRFFGLPYSNDMGRQVALATWGWTLLGKPDPDIRGELFIGAIYASTNVNMELLRVKKELKAAEEKGDVSMIAELQEELEKFEVAAADLERTGPKIYATLKEKIAKCTDPAAEIAKLNTAYENNDPETKEAVRRLVKICLDGFVETMGELGIGYDSFDYESDLVWEKKADEVLEALKKTNFVEHDQGALVLNCDEVANVYALKERWGLAPHHEIPRLVLVRGDGTTLYTLRDMAYSIYKFGTGVDTVINVIGQEQALAQLQLRIALVAIDKQAMGDNQLHYGYEFVKLPEGKMSGRLGRYVALNDVIDRSVELAFEEVTKRTPSLPDTQRRDIARMVGHGAVKYTLLSVDANKQVIFDWAKALDFETNSAPFIQYSYARCCNILKRAEVKPSADYGQLKDAKEREIVSLVSNWPEVFAETAEELKPGSITAYLNSLADKFNSFYSSLRVLNAETPGLIGARLALVDAVRVVLKNGCAVLGIDAPERM
jgi:arginyl-tRNA synthetase